MTVFMASSCRLREPDRAESRGDILQLLQERRARDEQAGLDAGKFRAAIEDMTAKLNASSVLSRDEAKALAANVKYGWGEPPVLSVSGTNGPRGAVSALDALASVKPGLERFGRDPFARFIP